MADAHKWHGKLAADAHAWLNKSMRMRSNAETAAQPMPSAAMAPLLAEAEDLIFDLLVALKDTDAAMANIKFEPTGVMPSQGSTRT